MGILMDLLRPSFAPKFTCIVEVDIITLFPEVALAPLSESILKRAQDNSLLSLRAHQLRDWAEGNYRKVDDYPYGGGVGMVLKPEPIFKAVTELRRPDSRVLLMSPQGKAFKQCDAQRLSQPGSHLIIICGHYEGVDQRVVEVLVDEEISIGDYVLTNGALASAVLIDAVTRLLPGALGDESSVVEESFSDPNLLEAPSYTKPASFQGHDVPEILLSGHHEKIRQWRINEAQSRTRKNRPDLYIQKNN